MKIKHLLILAFVGSLLIGCGSTSSINLNSAYPPVTITLNDSTVIYTKLISEDDLKLVVTSEEGWEEEYQKSEIKSYDVKKLKTLTPEEKRMKMMEDIVKNTNSTASATGILAGIQVVSILLVLILAI
jgi:hypothetical protein